MSASWSKAVRVRLKAVPAVGVEVAGTTEKEPAAGSLAGVVVEVVVVVVVPGGAVAGTDVVVLGGTDVVVTEVVVVVPLVVVVSGTTGATVSRPETPNMPDELSVTSNTVVPGSTRVTSTVVRPPVKVTLLLPVLQSP